MKVFTSRKELKYNFYLLSKYFKRSLEYFYSRHELKKTFSFFLWVFILWVIIRGFIIVPFTIPSESMKGTLLVGDYIAVSKFPYGYNKNSFIFSLPLLGYSKRVFYTPPKRGDIIVFLLPSNPSIYYIKRVIGLPQEVVEIKNSIIYINGKAVQRVPVEDYIVKEGDKTVQRIKQYKETLDNGASYNILDMEPNNLLEIDNVGPYVVPQDHFFVMGDNRDNSMDSRFTKSVGFIPVENLIGRAEVVIFSFKKALIPLKNRFWISLRPFIDKSKKEVKVQELTKVSAI